MPPKHWIRQYAGRLQLWLCLLSGLCSGGRRREHCQTGSIDSFCNGISSIYLTRTEWQLLRPVLSWNIARCLETSPRLVDFCSALPVCTGYHLMLNFYWAIFKFTHSSFCFTAMKTYWQENLCPPPVKKYQDITGHPQYFFFWSFIVFAHGLTMQPIPSAASQQPSGWQR